MTSSRAKRGSAERLRRNQRVFLRALRIFVIFVTAAVARLSGLPGKHALSTGSMGMGNDCSLERGT